MEKPEEKLSYYQAVGRRKEASAQVRMYIVDTQLVKVGEMSIAKGEIVVNGRKIEEYFRGEVYKKIYLEPFRTTNTLNRFALSVKIVGGGTLGQLEALVLGISRAIEKIDKEKFSPILKKRGFMTRDPRMKERRKAGYAQKARARKQSPKR